MHVKYRRKMLFSKNMDPYLRLKKIKITKHWLFQNLDQILMNKFVVIKYLQNRKKTKSYLRIYTSIKRFFSDLVTLSIAFHQKHQ